MCSLNDAIRYAQDNAKAKTARSGRPLTIGHAPLEAETRKCIAYWLHQECMVYPDALDISGPFDLVDWDAVVQSLKNCTPCGQGSGHSVLKKI